MTPTKMEFTATIMAGLALRSCEKNSAIANTTGVNDESEYYSYAAKKRNRFIASKAKNGKFAGGFSR